MPRRYQTAVALAAVLVLAGCGTAANAGDPTWVPKPTFAGEGVPPNIPGPPDPNVTSRPPSQRPGPRPSNSNSNSNTKSIDPFVVATKLTSPVGLAVLPDGTALVGERTTGRIVRVQPQPGRPVRTVRTLPGLSTAGGGGLLDLSLSPNYSQDRLIFAYLSTPRDNRVVTFTLNGPVTPVLIGIPRGTSDNAGRLVVGTDGLLYVATGDAGHPELAADRTSLAGKVLRVTDIGKPAPGNPVPSSPVFTSGHRVVDGLCVVRQTNTVVAVQAVGPDGLDNVNVLTGGDSYGWPASTPASTPPLTTLPPAQGGPGGCAILGDQLFVTSLDGSALLSTLLSARSGGLRAGTFATSLKNRYGRLLNVVADPRGAVLWLTTSNRDGHGRPVADDERVIRIPPPPASSSPA